MESKFGVTVSSKRCLNLPEKFLAFPPILKWCLGTSLCSSTVAASSPYTHVCFLDGFKKQQDKKISFISKSMFSETDIVDSPIW